MAPGITVRVPADPVPEGRGPAVLAAVKTAVPPEAAAAATVAGAAGTNALRQLALTPSAA